MDMIKKVKTICYAISNSMDRILGHYSRKDVQKELVEIARNREVGIKFGDAGYGKRPDVLQFEGDVLDLARHGATSFHVSEERWSDPLVLGGDSKKKINEYRIGWDLVIDVDTKFLDYAKICAKLLVDAIEFYDVKSYGIKFSGGTGMHIIIPFEAFPKQVNGKEVRMLFPDYTKIVAAYLKNMIKDELRKKILEISSVDEIMKVTKKKFDDVVKNNMLDPFCIVDIDPALISTRHLFRAAFSINEKTGLVSVPIRKEDIIGFDLKMAKIENVETGVKFLKRDAESGEASNLMVQAFDWHERNFGTRNYEYAIKEKKKVEYERPSIAMKPDLFAPCMLCILEGVKTDGRKRALFVLVNYLRKAGYEYDEIDNMLVEWNKKNYEQLKEGYIKSHVSWCKRQKADIMPPNCDNAAYYKDLNVCKPDFFCRNIKNPLQYKRKL